MNDTNMLRTTRTEPSGKAGSCVARSVSKSKKQQLI